MIYIQTDKGKVDIFSINKRAKKKIKLESEEITNKQNYIICMTARSGSTMLCSILEQTKLLGFPDEYINPRGVMPMYLSKFPSDNIYNYFSQLHRHQVSPNGFFGMKTSYTDFQPLLEQSLVGKLLNPVKFIYLDREDIVMQAVSLYIAYKTNTWHIQSSDKQQEVNNIDIDEEQIMKFINILILEKVRWETFFALYSINPLKITYESMVLNINETIETIGNFLGVDIINTYNLPTSKFKKIGNKINIEMVQHIKDKHKL